MTFDSKTYFDPQKIAGLQGLSLRAKHIASGLASGLHRSPHRGFSIEFAEHREYAPGDDLRHLDWKVFGRTDKYYLKQYEDETNLLCHLVLDASESMGYQSESTAMSKLEYGCCLVSSLTWLVLQQQDAVGLATFDEQVNQVVRPSASASQLGNVIRLLEEVRPTSRTAIGEALHELAHRLPRRGVVIVVSDLLDDVEAILSGLKHLRHQRHDVILFHLLDSAEREFPFRESIRLRGMEEMPTVEVDARRLQEAYLAAFQVHCDAIEKGCRSMMIDFVPVTTSEPFDRVLNQYLSARMGRVK